MIQCVNWEYLTDDIQKMLNEKDSIVKTIVQTCGMCPEQYECFDEYGNQIAYLRLRWGSYTVSCPDATFNSVHVYGTDTQGHGNFYDDTERLEQLSATIDAIDNYYNNTMQFVTKETDGNGDEVYKIKDEYTDDEQDVLRELYDYQQTHLRAFEVKTIREKGPIMSFRDCCIKVIKKHRLQRSKYFPEANGADGLSPDHTFEEEQFLLSDTEYVQIIRSICFLFDKYYGDFMAIFRECSEKGWNSL